MLSTLAPSFSPESLVEALRNLLQTVQVLSTPGTWNHEKLGFESSSPPVTAPCGPCHSSTALPFQTPPDASQPGTSCLVPTAQHGGGLVRTRIPFPEHVDGGAPCISFLTTSSIVGEQRIVKAAELRLHKHHTQFPPISRGLCWKQRCPAEVPMQLREAGPQLSTPRPSGEYAATEGLWALGSIQPGPPACPDSACKGVCPPQSMESQDSRRRVSSAGRQEAWVRVSTLPPAGLLEPLNSAPGRFLQIDQQRTHCARCLTLPVQGPPDARLQAGPDAPTMSTWQ